MGMFNKPDAPKPLPIKPLPENKNSSEAARRRQGFIGASSDTILTGGLGLGSSGSGTTLLGS